MPANKNPIETRHARSAALSPYVPPRLVANSGRALPSCARIFRYWRSTSPITWTHAYAHAHKHTNTRKCTQEIKFESCVDERHHQCRSLLGLLWWLSTH
jgi:hypothetical protein